MSSSRVCTATLNTYYCHALCHPGSLDCHAVTFQNTYYCHAKHLLLPHPLPHQKPFTATLNTFYCHALCHPASLYCHAKTFQNTYHCHAPITLETLYCHVAAYQCHTTATRLPYMSASQHPSRIGECQILRVGQFFMVEYLANTKL